MSSLTVTSCPAPFLLERNYPASGGYMGGRSCQSIGTNTSCCLPCPVTDYIYSRSFNRTLSVAYWLNIPSLLAEIFLLMTFIILSRLSPDLGQTYYLNVGLIIAMIMLQVSFTIPLGTKPETCYNAITPNDMYSSLSCAWTGALLVAGAMGIGVWIMLRTIWIHLRVCWNTRTYSSRWFWFAQLAGWGLMGIFMAVELPITGVSYRIGPACVPNQEKAFATWFGWLIAFGAIGALVQFATTAFCAGVYVKEVFRPTERDHTTSLRQVDGPMGSFFDDPQDQKKLAWSRVRKVLLTQWRSMVLSVVLLISLIFYGVVFVQQTTRAFQNTDASTAAKLQDWAICLVLNKGDKRTCGPGAKPLGLSEGAIVATYYMTSSVGMFALALIVRRAMFKEWLNFLRKPASLYRRASTVDIVPRSVTTNRKSLGRKLESEQPGYYERGVGRRPSIPRVPTIGDLGKHASGQIHYFDPTDPESAGVLPDLEDGQSARMDEIPPPPVMRPPSDSAGHDGAVLGPIPEAAGGSGRHDGPGVDVFHQDPYDVPKRTRRKAPDEMELV